MENNGFADRKHTVSCEQPNRFLVNLKTYMSVVMKSDNGSHVIIIIR